MANVTFVSNRAALLAAASDAKTRALEIMGGKAETYAKKLAPVDTGRLRASITHQQYDDETEIIGTNVEYAPFQELGTRYIPPHQFLRPAAENHANEYKQIWQNELNKIR